MRLSTFSTLSALLFMATPAMAQPGHGMGMGGMGMGMGMGPIAHCGMMLMHAPPAALKAKLGLNDGQIAKLQPLRTNFQSKKIGLEAQAKQAGLQLKTYLETADLPDQKKVLDLARKINNVHWQIVEERVKAQIQIMQILTKDQRTKLRTDCATMGPGGPGKGGHGHWGGGQGGHGPGHGPGGPGGM
jgi:Spy/CpxP family protein refolding chaperone